MPLFSPMLILIIKLSSPKEKVLCILSDTCSANPTQIVRGSLNHSLRFVVTKSS
jgi:hypothetical protein